MTRLLEIVCATLVILAGVGTAFAESQVSESKGGKPPRGVKCGNTTCLPGETCEQALVKCAEGRVCPQPPPKCFPPPTKGEQCGDTVCQADEQCLVILINCLEGATCVPPPPRCVPKSTPAPVENPSSCATVLCQEGYVCEERPLYNCRRKGCPKPPTRAECVPQVNPCAFTTCQIGFDCVPSLTDPTVAECRPPNPCDVVRCKSGYKCQVVTINCLVAPCPPSYGECVPTNPCRGKTCETGEICTQTEDDPTVAECVMSPCSYIRCGFNTTCEASAEECYTAPCPRPRGRCVPRDNPCELVDCRSGYTCVNSPVYACKKPPCPSKAKCVPSKTQLE